MMNRIAEIRETDRLTQEELAEEPTKHRPCGSGANQITTRAMSDTDGKITRFPRSTEAQCKGYHAGRRGCTEHDNPYELDTREARAWLRGLNEGRMRQLTVVRSH
jgi:ribosome modulation factor